MTTFAEHIRVAVSADRPTAVYRFFDADDHLLYVGITFNLGLRFAAHERLAPWWQDQRSVQIAWRESRTEAADEERRAISDEKPIFNVQGARAHRKRVARVRTDEATRKAIALEVRVQVARSGRSKREVREFLGVSRQAAWQRMCGVTPFADEELHALADFLGVPVSRFEPVMAVAA